jgi:hypothetical protein
MSCLLPPPLATSSLLSQARISFIFFSVLWIRIRIDFGQLEPDPDPGGLKHEPQQKKKVKKFHDLKYWMFSLGS